MTNAEPIDDRAWQRFESKIDRSGGADACHPWTSGLGQYGQPCFQLGKRTVSSRRFLWERAHGPLDKKKWVTDSCGSKICMNLRHLKIRTVKDDVTRFWEKVFKNEGDGCWIWTGWLQKGGYGAISINQNPVRAHRFSWELHYGPIPTGPEEICVLHKCDNPPCVRPDHLFLGTDKDNMHDMTAKGRAGWQKARENMRRLCEKAMKVGEGDSSEAKGTDE